jgi:hypothetical protein
MIRRTFLSTISALAVAPLGWLRWHKSSEPDIAVEIGRFTIFGERSGLTVKWRKSDGRIDVHQIDTGRALRCIEKTDDGWFVFQNDYAGIRLKIDPKGIGTITCVDYVFWKDQRKGRGLQPAQGIKDSTKPSGCGIDWFAWNEHPTGEHHA